MNNQEHHFTLIDNTYSAEQAREVITSLISDKISFLNTQMLSIHERTGESTSHLEKRVNQLDAERTKLIALFADCAENSQDLEISCQVKLVTKQAASIEA